MNVATHSEKAERFVPASRAHCPTQPSSSFRTFPREWIEQSVATCFERQVRETPDRLAVKCASAAWSYDELNRAANRLARALVLKCGETSAPVAFVMQRGPHEMAAILGILKAAKFYVPLDPSFPQARLAQAVADVQPQAVVTNNQQQALARELIGNRLPIVNVDEIDTHGEADNLGLPITPDYYAYVLFTSSSTGRAKGLLLDQRSLLHHVMKLTNTIYLSREDRFALLPSSVTAASTLGIFGSLLNGSAVFPYDVQRAGLPGLADWLANEEITIYHSVPTTFRGLIDTLKGQTFPNMRLIRLGGEAIARSDVEMCRAHFGPNCIFNSSLGSTEITTLRQCFFAPDTPLESSRVPVGYELEDTEILLLDEQGKPVGENCTGEIVVKSPYLAVGYWNNPELTSRVFRSAPDGSGQRLYFTGDLGLMRADGCLEHHGRKDFLIKVRGYRIEAEEVEMALLDLDSVRQAVVVARKDRPGETRLVAYLVPRRQPMPTVTALRAHLRKLLPNYMLPSAFVILDALPQIPTGKVDRRALPPPSTNRPALESKYVPPWDPSQLLLAELWEEMLNVRPIGLRDDFFDLGGDSLLAVSLLTRLEEMYGRAVPQAEFMAQPTIAGLRRSLIEHDRAQAQPPLVKLRAGNGKTPFIFLHGDYNGGGYYCYSLARHLSTELPFYLIHPHGLFSQQVPLSIEGMAMGHLETLLAAQPKGSYALGGHCNGALVALEMARLLISRGCHVESLILIAPPPIKPSVANAAQQSAPAQSTADERSLQLSGKSTDERRPLLLTAYRNCFATYAPDSYSGPLTVFQPVNEGPAAPCWRELSSEACIRMIPGGHLTSITRYAAELASQLNQCLV